MQTAGGPDAVTEHWVPAAIDLLTPERAYATRQDFEAVLADDRTLFESFELYVVDQETHVVPGEPLDSPLGEASPEAKMLWTYRDPNAVPPPPGTRRVVDNHVRHKLIAAERGEWKAVERILR